MLLMHTQVNTLSPAVQYSFSKLPYSWKYWPSLNSAVWPQTDCKKTLVEFKFGGGISDPFIKERCHLSLEVLEQSHEFTNLQEIKLAACQR